MIELKLPVPPTINHYYIRTRRGMFIGKKGVAFREETALLFKQKYPSHETSKENLKVNIDFTPPDRRRRDVDNILKCLLDSLEKSGIYKDDSQIIELRVRKLDPAKPGFITVTVEEI